MSDFDQFLAEQEPGDETGELMEDMMLPSLDPVVPGVTGASNVMIDQSPLQPQLQKNKECK